MMDVKGSAMELWAAVRRNDGEGIRREVGAGADANASRRLPETTRVLEWAAGETKVEMETLRVLLDAGAWSANGASCAAGTGDLERVKLFEGRGMSLTDIDQHGYTALHRAILRARVPAYELVTYLLDAGVDPDRSSSYGETAIGYALSVSEFGIARLLLDRGAMRTHREWPKILTAVIQRDFEGIDRHRNEVNAEFFSFGQWAPIQVAMRMGDLEMVQKLADLGADRRFKDRGDYTLFHAAVTGGSIPVIEWCAEHVCGGKIEGGHLEGAHQAAAASGRISMARWLFEHGVPMTDEYFASPLHSCVTPEMADFYLEQGEAIDGISGEGYSVLMRAAEEEDLTMAAHWIRRGANVDATSTGATALHYAVRADSDAMVDLLLQAGANVNAQDVDDDTALSQANSLAMARKLIAAGARLDLKNIIDERVQDALVRRDKTFEQLFR